MESKKPIKCITNIHTYVVEWQDKDSSEIVHKVKRQKTEYDIYLKDENEPDGDRISYKKNGHREITLTPEEQEEFLEHEWSLGPKKPKKQKTDPILVT